MQANSAARATPNASAISRRDWAVLGITVLFWLFDGYETYALLLTIGPSLHELLPAPALPGLPRYAAYLISFTLFGWAVGGIIGGFVGDRLGRRRTMIGAVILYSIFTGTSALAHSWEILALTRFCTGLGIGAEWGVGTSLLQETWPAKWRTKGAGLLQSAFSGGFVIASLIWIVIGGTFGGSWRWMYIIGIVPALVVATLGRAIPESARWKAARAGSEVAQAAATAMRTHRRTLIIAVIVSVSITVGFWAISSWVPTFAGILAHDPKRAVFFAGWAGVLYALGEIGGCIAFGYLADAWGRKPTAMFYLAGSVVITSIVFLLVHDPVTFVALQLVNGFLTGGLYGWYAIHPPELFPTIIRSSAISTIFNSARFLAMLGPIATSALLGFFGGYGIAATIFGLVFIIGIVAVAYLPETRGLPLPE